MASGKSATIHYERRAGHPRRHRTGQEEHRVRHILGRANSGNWPGSGFFHERFRRLSELSAFAAQHRRIDITGTDTVDADVVLAVVDRHGARQIDYGSLSRTVRSRLRPTLE